MLYQSNILNSQKIRNIHFIGIGGISMSGLSKILSNLGYKISGSDLRTTNITHELIQSGINVFEGHSADNISNPDLIIYTAAINKDNPELIKARTLGVPVIERSDLLGEITKAYRYNINIAGTHGKTTTTSMVSIAMIEAQKDPTVHLGGELDIIGGNTRLGGNDFFVMEACEYVDSFLKFDPYLAIVLNIDSDHLDYFRDLAHIKSSFSKFVKRLPKDGHLVLCADDENSMELINEADSNIITYGIDSKQAIWKAKDITFNNYGCASYTLSNNNESVCQINMNVPGHHNILNSLAAISSCYTFGCNMDLLKKGIEKFKGTKRRFEYKGEKNGITVVDDYAHHPTEILATLNAAKKGSYNSIWCIFQPHTYTRTKKLLNEFSESFFDADHIIVADIYAARELDTGEIHSKDVVEKLQFKGLDASYFSNFEEISEYLTKKVSPGDLVITLGAGNIFTVGELFLA